MKRGKEGLGGGPMFGLRWGDCVDLQGDEGRKDTNNKKKSNKKWALD